MIIIIKIVTSYNTSGVWSIGGVVCRWMTIVERRSNLWLSVMGVISRRQVCLAGRIYRCGYQDVGVTCV